MNTSTRGQTVPYRPESLPVLQARWPRAVAEPIDVESCVLGNAVGAGGRPECVFDFVDGLRIVASYEVLEGSPDYLHVSASVVPDGALHERIRNGQINPETFISHVQRAFESLSGIDINSFCLGFSGAKGVPHWIQAAGPKRGSPMSENLAFPDETDWIELPRCTARLYRPGLKPCTECGSTLWNIVLVRRQVKTGPGEPPAWEEDVSIECPTCKQESARRSDVRRVIARLDKRRGLILDAERTPEMAQVNHG